VIIEEKPDQEDGKTPSLSEHALTRLGSSGRIVNLNVQPAAQPLEQPSVLQTLEGQARLFYYTTKQKHQDQLDKIIKVIDGGLQLSPKRQKK
jgi:hypothetical protein